MHVPRPLPAPLPKLGSKYAKHTHTHTHTYNPAADFGIALRFSGQRERDKGREAVSLNPKMLSVAKSI